MCKNEIATQALCYHMRFYFRSMVFIKSLLCLLYLCASCALFHARKKITWHFSPSVFDRNSHDNNRSVGTAVQIKTPKKKN